MGAMSRRLSNLGGQVRGVKPRPFLKFEKDHQLPTYGHQTLVDDLQTQKIEILQLSDILVFIPGGWGTIEELVTLRAWFKLGKVTVTIA